MCAAELAQRMLKDGAKNSEITKMFNDVADAYDVRCCEGVLSHQMKRHVIDAEKTILIAIDFPEKNVDLLLARRRRPLPSHYVCLLQ